MRVFRQAPRRNKGRFPDVRERTVAKLLERGARHHIFSALGMGDEDEVRSTVARDPGTVNKRMTRFDDFDTPLHQACMSHVPAPMLSVLIELGADLEATDRHGFTPLDQTALFGEVERAELLLESGADVGIPAAFFLEREADIERLLDQNPNCLAPEGKWDSLIVFAAERRPARVVERLLAHGATVNATVTSRGTESYTPLHGAAYDGNLEAARLLIQQGADLSVRDKTHNSTPLGWARHSGQKELEKLLLDHGAEG